MKQCVWVLFKLWSRIVKIQLFPARLRLHFSGERWPSKRNANFVLDSWHNLVLCLRFNSFTLYSNQSCTDNDEDRPYTADSARQDTESEPNKYFEVWNLSELWEKSLRSACFDNPYRDISIYTQCNEEQEWERDISAVFRIIIFTSIDIYKRVMSTLLMFKIKNKNIALYLDLHTMQWGAGERERHFRHLIFIIFTNIYIYKQFLSMSMCNSASYEIYHTLSSFLIWMLVLCWMILGPTIGINGFPNWMVVIWVIDKDASVLLFLII